MSVGATSAESGSLLDDSGHAHIMQLDSKGSPSFLDLLVALSPRQPTTEARQSGVAVATIMDIVVV